MLFNLNLTISTLVKQYLTILSIFCSNSFVLISCCRNYVQRAFASAVNEVQKDCIEKHLKEKLTQVFNDGTAYTTDWDKESIPGYD